MTTAYLTVDDAPSADLPAKLDVLTANDVPALLFCEGRRLADHPDHARRAIEAGFHLGNHLYDHPHASERSVAAFADELDRTDSLIEDSYADAGVDRPAKLFRFPYGDRGGDRADEFQRVLETRDFVGPDPEPITYDWYGEDHADARDWFWTIAVDDWAVDSRAELEDNLESCTDRLAAPSPDIVLFHDGGNSPELFADFLHLLLERDITFGDPLSLVTSSAP